jgi:hypothetical protein
MMSEAIFQKTRSRKPVTEAQTDRLFFLDLSSGRVTSCTPDGMDLKTIMTLGRKLPDGIVVDAERGHIYWTNMGIPNANDGCLMRSDLGGANITTIVPEGATHTPKQLQLDKENGRLYWCDREGMRVMRVNLDGSNLETLIDTSQGDSLPGTNATKWCVGIALDVERGQLYWTQKGPDNAGQGRIFRAGLEIPKGERPDHREDIELLYGGLPEPIDLDLDVAARVMYWTDRGDPPRGNTVNRAPMDAQFDRREDPEIVFKHLMEGIGLALDLKNARMFLTDLGGSVYRCNLDGSEKKVLLITQGNLSGIAYVELPR